MKYTMETKITTFQSAEDIWKHLRAGGAIRKISTGEIYKLRGWIITKSGVLCSDLFTQPSDWDIPTGTMEGRFK